MDEEKKEEYTARDYQVQLLSIALNENTILYLPTGSGKTFVAVLLIKCLSQDLEKPFRAGGKRTFFAVNTVALVKQQGDYVARHTHLKVGKYSGDMNVDGWGQERWVAELKENQVIVLTCQILLDMLQYGTLKLEDINLLIFDECHHAVADHCMRRVMKQFENCPKDLQPRVLGLSATLLNSNCKSDAIPQEIKTLESTFQAKVATVDDLSIVQQFSTNPKESFIKYMKGFPHNAVPGIHALLSEVLDHIETAKKIVESLQPGILSDVNEPQSSDLPLKRLGLSPDKREKKKINSVLNDIKVMFEDLGVYGGFCATLFGLIALHRRKLKIYTVLGKLIVTGCITHLILIRKIISKELDKYTPMEQITKFSTMKVLSLLETLKEVENEEKCTFTPKELLGAKNKAPVKESCGLIFVERRSTAKTLYYILKNAAEHYPGLSSVSPEFVVGIAANPLSSECSLMKRQHDDAIKRFRSGECNYLVASDVMEEGVDVPLCDLVLKFDLPKTFRSYVQSKGRARHSSSKFMLFVPEDDFSKFRKCFAEYQKIEATLKKILIGKTDSRNTPSEEEIKRRLYQQNIPPYYSEDGSASVDAVSSVSLIHRYCSLLPQDKFTLLNPLWLLDERVRVKVDQFSVMQKVAYLQLPINSPLRHIIKGIPMENKHSARQAVALIACVILHRMGELGKNDLLPITQAPVVLNDRILFPHWKDESKDNGIPGSKKRIQRYSKQVAEVVKNCHPKPDGVTYVHHIHQKPVYQRPPVKDSRGNALYDVLSMDRGYAIISSKKLPKLCDFSIYMRSGEIEVQVGDDTIDEVMLTSKQITELEDFHYMVFFDLLSIGKQFVVVDKSYHENSYLIAPTFKDTSGKWVIDWQIAKKFHDLPEVCPVNEDDIAELVVDNENFLHEVVTPWYRGELSEKNYVVSKICNDMNASSDFPSTQYDSYKMYFDDKYNLKVMRPELPLLEVKAISDRIDCIHPRGVVETFDDTPCMSKRQMMLKQGDFNEHLIPELVTRRLFPATLWLKATALPTILHRLSFLLLAYELRKQICIEAEIGSIDPPEGNVWKPLQIEASYEVIDNGESQKPARTVPSDFFSTKENCHKEHSEVIAVDIDRSIEELSMMDIMQHHKLEIEVNNPKVEKDVEWLYIDPAIVPQNVLHRLRDNQSSGSCMGPELADVLCALTSDTSNDVINLERLETLGDSFLKFAASTYLFLKYPKTDEGRLTTIKGKLISNRNLYYCAQNKSLGGKLKKHSFAPNSDWYPPGVVVPTFLKEKLKHHEGITNNVLFKLTIPEADRRSGILSRDTKEDIVRSLEDKKSNNIIGKMSPTLENILGIQNVPDKSLADSVEALIGAWLLTGGFASAFRLLGWFGILPQGPNGLAGRWEELIDEDTMQSSINVSSRDQEPTKIIGGVIDWGPDCEVNKLVKSTEDITFNMDNAEREKTEKSSDTSSLIISKNGNEKPAERYFEIIPIEQLGDRKNENRKELTNKNSVSSHGCIQKNESNSCLMESAVEENSTIFEYDSEEEEDDRLTRESMDYFHGSESELSGAEMGIVDNETIEDLENSSRGTSSDFCNSINRCSEDDMVEYEESKNILDCIWDDDEKSTGSSGYDISEDEPTFSDPPFVSSDEYTAEMSSNSSGEMDDLVQSPYPCKRIKLSTTSTTNEQKLLEKNISENKVKMVEDYNRKTIKSIERMPLERRIYSGISLCSAKITTSGTCELQGTSWNLNSVDALLPSANAIENLINYKFKNRLLLLQAFTHASFHLNRITECYQRLEFLGDAVLDYIITCHIYETCGKLNPGQLTDLRSSLVNNITFASLAVRYGLHRHLLHLSKSLMDAIDVFVDFQLQRNHEVTEECLTLMFEEECMLAENVEVPKALGDIMESLAGAIYLDSGLSLSTVWKVFYPMMKKEIDAFSKNVPKQPVRELHESDAYVFFMPAETVETQIIADSGKGIAASKTTVMVPLEVREKSTGKSRLFNGFGPNKALAKRAAAKLALKAMAKS